MKQAFLKVNKMSMRYLEAGNAGTENVLFLHGLGSSGDRWLDIPDALSLQGLRAIAIDLPGFGLSDKPVIDYTIDKFAKAAAGFLDEARISKATIVGHSLGGYIALRLAMDRPDVVERLVLIDSSGTLGQPTPLLSQYLEVATNPSRQTVRAVFEQLVADPLRIPDILVDGFIYRIRQPGALHAFKTAFDNSVYTHIGAEVLRQIGEAGIHTLIIWGMQDNLIPLKHARTFQESIKGSELVIVEDAGHAPFAEKPAIVSELLRRFLRGQR